MGMKGVRARLGAITVALAVVLSLVGSVAVLAVHTGGDARAVGPVSADHGYPVWYRDGTGTELELCLDFGNPYCGFVGNEIPSPGLPVTFPDNFPGEAFWWTADSVVDTGGVGRPAMITMALEAAFASGETPLAGDQISFSRVRVRMDGLIPHARYAITYPYGSLDVVAEGDGSVFFTRDIGSLAPPADFGAPLDSPQLARFLEWDTDLNLLPDTDGNGVADFLGDPAVEHTVTGSPTGNNLFRIEGPPGSFSSSLQKCADPALGADGLAIDDCVETDLFVVMGKRAVTAGVEGLRANYSALPGGGASLDVFARSLPGQTITVAGAGIATVVMRGDGDLYHAKIDVPGALPTEVVVTNQGDGSAWAAAVSDIVTIGRAEYDVDTGILTVDASSSDVSGASTLMAHPGGALVGGTVAAPLTTAPLSVTVTSSGGGSDTEPVHLIGAAFPAIDVVAVADIPPTAAAGQVVTLDGLASTGDIQTYAWTQIAGPPVTIADPTAGVTTFVAPSVAGDLAFELTVSGLAGTSVTQGTVTVSVGVPPVANAGADQSAIVGTVVALDGSGSAEAAIWQWTQLSGPAVSLAGESFSSPTFTMPVSASPLVFELTVSNSSGVSTDTVAVSQVIDQVTMDRGELRRGKGELRIDGTASVTSVVDVVSVYAGDGLPGVSGPLLGTALVDPLTGTFAFRETGVTLTTRTVDIVTSRGGLLDDAAVSVRR